MINKFEHETGDNFVPVHQTAGGALCGASSHANAIHEVVHLDRRAGTGLLRVKLGNHHEIT